MLSSVTQPRLPVQKQEKKNNDMDENLYFHSQKKEVSERKSKRIVIYFRSSMRRGIKASIDVRKKDTCPFVWEWNVTSFFCEGL